MRNQKVKKERELEITWIVAKRTSHTLSIKTEHERKRPPGWRSRPCRRAHSCGLLDGRKVTVVPTMPQNLLEICLGGSRRSCPWVESYTSEVSTKPPEEMPGKLFTGRCVTCDSPLESHQKECWGSRQRWAPLDTTPCKSQELENPTVLWFLDAGEAVCAEGLDGGEIVSCSIFRSEAHHIRRRNFFLSCLSSTC